MKCNFIVVCPKVKSLWDYRPTAPSVQFQNVCISAPISTTPALSIGTRQARPLRICAVVSSRRSRRRPCGPRLRGGPRAPCAPRRASWPGWPGRPCRRPASDSRRKRPRRWAADRTVTGAVQVPRHESRLNAKFSPTVFFFLVRTVQCEQTSPGNSTKSALLDSSASTALSSLSHKMKGNKIPALEFHIRKPFTSPHHFSELQVALIPRKRGVCVLLKNIVLVSTLKLQEHRAFLPGRFAFATWKDHFRHQHKQWSSIHTKQNI